MSNPDYYERPLSEESASLRDYMEDTLESVSESVENESNPINRIRLLKKVDLLEYRLSWQGADPRIIDRKELTSVCNQSLHEDPVIDKYRSKVRNPATAIRAYCVNCMGGSVASIRDCASLLCPLWNFRNGKDPLRGFALPPYPVLPAEELESDDLDDLFSDGDETDDEDTEE